MFKEEVINRVSFAGVERGAQIIRQKGQRKLEMLPEGSAKLSVGLHIRDELVALLMDVSDREHLKLEHLERILQHIERSLQMAMMGEGDPDEQQYVIDEFRPKLEALEECVIATPDSPLLAA